MLFELLQICIAILYFVYVRRRRKPSNGDNNNNSDNQLKKKQLIPGPPTVPILGSYPFAAKLLGYYKWLFMRNYEVLHLLSTRYGEVFSGWTGAHYMVYVEDFDVAKALMSSDEWINRYNDHPMFYERSFNKPLGLALAKGEGWKEMRRFTIRTLRNFGFGKGNSLEMSLNTELDEILYIFNQQVDLKPSQTGVIDMHNMFNVHVLNVVWTMIAGSRFSRNCPKLRRLMIMLEKVSKTAPQGLSFTFCIPFLRYIPYLTTHQLNLKLHRETQNMFKEIIKQRRAKGDFMHSPSDFIDVFLREIEELKMDPTNPKVKYYTEEQLIMVCVDLFFTGGDTTSTTLEFAILYMLLNPEIQRKVQEEIDLVIGDQKVTLDHKLRMPYTEATTMEIMRYSTILPITARSPVEDNEINGYLVPKGTMVGINLHQLHFSEKYWDDPKTFRPERFLDENNNIINSQKLLAFGHGKRGCPGERTARASVFIFLVTLLQRYTFEPSPIHKFPTTDPISGFNQHPQPFHALVKLRY